jgi:uridine kinase
LKKNTLLIIGIAGGSGSGKTTVVNKIIETLPSDSVALMPQDAYYYDNGHLSKEEKLKINFDHPNSIEFELLAEHIKLLKKGQTIEQPIYNYVTCARATDKINISPKRVVIVEGILILTNEKLRRLLDIKLFVDTPKDDRLMRIIRRDVQERGRNYNDAFIHYEKFVKPMHQQFIEPTKLYADVIIPQGGNNKVAIEMVSSRIQLNLNNT